MNSEKTRQVFALSELITSNLGADAIALNKEKTAVISGTSANGTTLLTYMNGAPETAGHSKVDIYLSDNANNGQRFEWFATKDFDFGKALDILTHWST